MESLKRVTGMAFYIKDRLMQHIQQLKASAKLHSALERPINAKVLTREMLNTGKDIQLLNLQKNKNKSIMMRAIKQYVVLKEQLKQVLAIVLKKILSKLTLVYTSFYTLYYNIYQLAFNVLYFVRPDPCPCSYIP